MLPAEHPPHEDYPIPHLVRDQIEDRLAALERRECARIVFAVESGSRAWGFA
jgi:hypothetical protein